MIRESCLYIVHVRVNSFLVTMAGAHDVIRMLLEAYPESTQIKDICGRLPLHLSCFNSSSLAFVMMLLEASPKATWVKCDNGKLPLQHACFVPTDSIMRLIYEVYPEAAQVQDSEGKLPLHIACEFALGIHSLKAMELLLSNYPNNVDVEDNNMCHQIT
jgi:ankyrin repeat protein